MTTSIWAEHEGKKTRMSDTKPKVNLAYNYLLAAVLVVLLIVVWRQGVSSWQWFLLIAAVGLVGFTFGVKHAAAVTEPNAMTSIQAHASPEQAERQPAEEPKADYENTYLHGILEELSLMQNSEDILERYRGFVRVIESSLQQVLGDCGISLWCPDHGYQKLVECVIHPTQGNQSRINTKLLQKTNRWRTPCEVPLDSPVIRDSLKTGRAYCAVTTDSENLMAGRAAEATLPCDACIPLYRSFGQPLLIQVERTGSSMPLCKLEAFQRTVKLIRFFWKQLQATNQRQWLAEHDEPTGALREEAFLTQGQAWSDRFARQDELFAVVVITVRGYRSMFAGDSARWRQLSKTLGRSLRKILTDQFDKFLLGKMADDVFALMLPGIDQFLCETTIHRILKRLEQEILQEPEDNLSEIPFVDIHWAGADHTHYEGNVEELLNNIYCRLFTRREHSNVFAHQIALNERDRKTEVSSCK